MVVVGAIIGGVTYVKLFRESPAPYFASDEEHFLFGSMGTEAEGGVPYWIWLVLPRLFPEYLPRPGGYATLGMLGKDGHEMPVGLSKVTVGVPGWVSTAPPAIPRGGAKSPAIPRPSSPPRLRIRWGCKNIVAS
jgi:hypothetical protein